MVKGCFHAVLPLMASSGICSCNMMQAFITCSGCHPCIFLPTKTSSKILLSPPSVMHESCYSLMIPLSEHTDHKLLVRLTTANSVIISSQKTSGKSSVGNAALSELALLNFPYRFLCYIQVQGCPLTFFLEFLVDYTDTAGIGSKSNVLADITIEALMFGKE